MVSGLSVEVFLHWDCGTFYEDVQLKVDLIKRVEGDVGRGFYQFRGPSVLSTSGFLDTGRRTRR